MTSCHQHLGKPRPGKARVDDEKQWLARAVAAGFNVYWDKEGIRARAAIFGIQGKLAQGSTACTCVALVGGRGTEQYLGWVFGRCSIRYSLVAQELSHVGRSRSNERRVLYMRYMGNEKRMTGEGGDE